MLDREKAFREWVDATQKERGPESVSEWTTWNAALDLAALEAERGELIYRDGKYAGFFTGDERGRFMSKGAESACRHLAAHLRGERIGEKHEAE